MSTKRNERCPCGSGRKYKKCCGSPTANCNLPDFESSVSDTQDIPRLIRSNFNAASHVSHLYSSDTGKPIIYLDTAQLSELIKTPDSLDSQAVISILENGTALLGVSFLNLG